MNKKIITIIIVLAAVCGGVSAQPKVSGRVPTREKRGYDQRFVIDTASVRVLYALNAKDIKDESTYIDLGKLEVGKRVKKYADGLSLVSDNPAYPPIYFTAQQVQELPVRFIGKCTEVRTKL